MRLLSSGEEFAVFSVGQEAFGLIAFGQFARGFIAVGQVAVGVVAIGQGAAGVIGLGQGGIGIMWFSGMAGVGGRGFCLRLIPGLDKPRITPPTVPLESIWQQPGSEGLVRVRVGEGQDVPTLWHGEQRLSVKLTPETAGALRLAHSQGKVHEIYASLRRVGDVVVCSRLVEVPGARKTGSLGFNIARAVALIGLGVLWWWLVLEAGW
jgi:hypothetical protein